MKKFFVKFVVSFVSMIALRKGKGNLCRRVGACIEQSGSKSRSVQR